MHGRSTYYARTKGADAILLIAAVLPDLDIKYMIKICKMLGLATLVEKHLRLILVTQRNSLKESVAKRSVRKITL
ncbi:hypothetical protein LWI29_030442 [Acer saccharum]|uniref:Indole-3-glycerol-phosphate synthase n=1 Tax=Acer saccharum TaxID=4024 RepID=A0AA39W7C8_ACESA|nr:hypothetical protein LWI29_030442 [Acer saccharum]